MPLLVAIGGWLSGISVAFLIVSVVASVAGWLPFSYEQNVYLLVFINLVLSGIVFALLARKPWSRHLMMLFWVVVLVAEIGAFPGQRRGAVELGCTGVLGLIGAGAYLYLKSGVVEYFDALKSRAVPTSRATAAGDGRPA